MEDTVYRVVTEKFCADGFCFENIRLQVQRDIFRTISKDFDLIALSPKKIIFFVALDNDLNSADTALVMRGALNYLAGKLSVSINSLVVCGANEEHYFYLNKFNDRLSVWERDDECADRILACIENEMFCSPDVFNYDSMLRMNDLLLLSSCPEKGADAEKTRVAADGTVYVRKRGFWREASAIDTDTLYFMAALGGMFGLHLFYQQKRAKGVLYLFTFGLFGIGWFFDSLEILLGVYRDPDGRYLVPLQNKLFGFLVLVGGAALFGILGLAAMFLVRFLAQALSEGIFPLFEDLDYNIEEEF